MEWNGTEKQVSWARKIKGEMLSYFEAGNFGKTAWEDAKVEIQKWIQKGIKKYGDDKSKYFYRNMAGMAKQNHYAELVEEFNGNFQKIDEFIDFLKNNNNAKFWIDKRNYSIPSLANIYKKGII